MSPDRRPAPSIVRSRWGSLGDLAAAAFIVAGASGVALAVPFDPADAYGSIAAMLLVNPGAAFFRSMHYWAGQMCLVLTVLHLWDHLRVRTERHVGRGVWLRLSLALPLLAFIMLSGFILRGDPEARQALRIVTEATAQIPWIGSLAALLVFGPANRLDVVYVQHAAVATIVVWLFIVEHSRRVWPRPLPLLAVTLVTAAISLVLTPGLHDGLDPILKGPWYFLGLQEILHWTPWPRLVLLSGAVVVGAIFAVRVFRPAAAARTKGILLALSLAYAVLCGVGAFLRGENWSLAPTWPGGSAGIQLGWAFGSNPDLKSAPSAALPIVMDRPEGCVVCHSGVSGFSNAHRPDAVGCASCHGGDVFTLHKARAHAGMELIPGNLRTAARRCGQASCHASIVPRVERSVMSTMSGIVAIDRAVFGEGDGAPEHGTADVRQLGRTRADTHLRQLCASCHLGRAKTALGANGEDARGGGCNACHLVYSAAASEALQRYEREKAEGRHEAPLVHPALSLDIGSGQCFGCHSRSGRISTSYEGWSERHEPPEEASGPTGLQTSQFRRLPDDRVFERVIPDVHQERGLDCIDCHTANEVMGDGVAHARKRDQLRVTCEDCHAPAVTGPAIVPATQLDPEARKILRLRAWPAPAPAHYVRAQSGEILVNVIVSAAGRLELIRKRTGDRRESKPTAAACVEGRGHARLSCGSCHTAWAPRCPTCHTTFDARAEAYDWLDDRETRGAWEEQAGAFAALSPTLGVRRIGAAAGPGREVIETFAPGMIVTIDLPQRGSQPAGTVFRRLYARTEPHTTRREARSCESCHNDPVAVGYGAGELRYEKTPSGGRWRFTPTMELLPGDLLPADARIPFLGARTSMLSTREDVRPFTVEEQRRILRVGACLTCHDGRSPVMRDSVRDFEALLARRSPRCVLPAWD
jgi:hypothetical protein